MDFAAWSKLEAAACSAWGISRENLIRRIKEAWPQVLTPDFIIWECSDATVLLRADVNGSHIEGIKDLDKYEN